MLLDLLAISINFVVALVIRRAGDSAVVYTSELHQRGQGWIPCRGILGSLILLRCASNAAR